MSGLGAMVAKYATRAMLASAAKAATKGAVQTAKLAIPSIIAHKVASTIKRKRDNINKTSRRSLILRKQL